MPTQWSMKGTLLGACSCDWGCPCSFNARPTQGFCEGSYVWHIDQGNFGDVSLDGLSWAWLGASPGPLHEGNVTWLIFADERATPAQRQALETLAEGNAGGPWTIFSAVASKKSGPHFASFEMHVDGIRSSARIGASILELELGPILNPVTGSAEELYVHKPTGFTSKHMTLGAANVLRVNTDVKFDHSGKYGEYSTFEYAGESQP